MAHVFAQPADFYSFIGSDEPDDEAQVREVETLLRRASIAVEAQLRTAKFRRDGEGLPVDPGLREALRDAACAWAAWFQTMDPTGADGNWAGMTNQGVSLTKGGASGVDGAFQSRVSPEAIDILQNAGLLFNPVGRSPAW